MEQEIQDKLNINNEEEEDREKEPEPQILEFDIDLKEKIQCPALYVGLFGIGSLYLQGKTKQNSVKIGTINFERTKQRALADIYQLKSKEVIILFNDTLLHNLDYQFADTLFEKIIPQRVIVLDNIHENILENVDEKQKVKGLRTINSSACKMTNSAEVCGQLEVGNSVKGIAADLLIFAEYNGMQCEVFIGLVSEYEFTLKDLDVFKALEMKFVPLREKWVDADVKKAIKYYNLKSSQANLYL